MGNEGGFTGHRSLLHEKRVQFDGIREITSEKLQKTEKIYFDEKNEYRPSFLETGLLKNIIIK